ncbi:MAG: hypothetical protein JWO69_1849 [Thermoleophilia bacterium]|jgi:hypothetical protein|nr:hypothetical protein [Thermoleophilia bacterium]
MPDFDERVRSAFGAERPVETDVWERVLVRLDDAPVVSARRRRLPVRVLLVAALVAALLSGIAVAAEPGLLDRIFPGGSGADRMQAMKDPVAQPREPLPEDVAMMLEHMSGATDDPVVAEEYRVLLDHAEGEVATTLYAFATRSGEVCYMWHGTFGSGGCSAQTFAPGSVLSHGASQFELRDGTTWTTAIQGLTTDEVARVRVRMVDGSIQDAIMGDNAFLWYPRPYDDLYRYAASAHPERLSPPDRSEPERLVVELDDGSTREVQVRPKRR